jgi:hypothetical protein
MGLIMSTASWFQKLYKVPIPVNKYLDFYIYLYSQSPEFHDLPSLLKDLYTLTTLYSGQIKELINLEKTRLLEYLNQIPDMEVYLEEDKIELYKDIPVINGQGLSKYYVSIDIREANHRAFMAGKELVYTEWKDLCAAQGIPVALKNSKWFREYFYGSIPGFPKKARRFQHHWIGTFYNYIRNFCDFRIVFKSDDELVFALDKWTDVYFLIDLMKSLSGPEIYPSKRVERVLGLNDDGLYTTLHGVSGLMYPLLFCEHVLHMKPEEIPEKARCFVHEGREAIWK